MTNYYFSVLYCANVNYDGGMAWNCGSIEWLVWGQESLFCVG